MESKYKRIQNYDGLAVETPNLENSGWNYLKTALLYHQKGLVSEEELREEFDLEWLDIDFSADPTDSSFQELTDGGHPENEDYLFKWEDRKKLNGKGNLETL